LSSLTEELPDLTEPKPNLGPQVKQIYFNLKRLSMKSLKRPCRVEGTVLTYFVLFFFLVLLLLLFVLRVT